MEEPVRLIALAFCIVGIYVTSYLKGFRSGQLETEIEKIAHTQSDLKNKI